MLHVSLRSTGSGSKVKELGLAGQTTNPHHGADALCAEEYAMVQTQHAHASSRVV